jgi:hypothetical protein
MIYTNSESNLQIREDVQGDELDKRSAIKIYTQQAIEIEKFTQ